MTKCTSSTPKDFFTKGKTIGFLGYGDMINAGVQFNNDEIMYDSWGPVTVNVGNGSALNYSAAAGFTQPNTGYGFIVCEWAHDSLPQLFALAERSPKIPSTCALVKLVKLT